ncbi:MAG: SAM-dependent methyltransferase [Coprothermobacterota bacterium]|nr:SAM-dependent methyltransferase [Coprothermobacterota bacterium]
MKSRRKIPAHQTDRELPPALCRQLLQELHLLTREGDLNADARRKLKQVNHLISLLEPTLDDLFQRVPAPVIVDIGSGKSYLGFLLYDLVLRHHPSGRIIGVEPRPELVEGARALALRLGFERMEFQPTRADRASLPAKIDLLVALHACDTATDDAILLGLQSNAEYIVVIPCCQAEVAGQLRKLKGLPLDPQQCSRAAAGSPLAELYTHPLHRREFGSHLTNVLRALALQAAGYQVTVTELVGWEHSLKSEVILGRRIEGPRSPSRLRLQALLDQFSVCPKLIRDLGYCATAPCSIPGDPGLPNATGESIGVGSLRTDV